MTDAIPSGTTFVSATLPHLTDGSVITWSWPSLLNEGRLVTLTVAAEISAPTQVITISNENYRLSSDGIDPISGPPIVTTVTLLTYNRYFPVIFYDEKSD